MTRKAALVALAAIVLGGCAGMRSVDVGSSSAVTYRIDVYNARTGTVTVSYVDGSNERELGTVSPGATERFIIASPASTTVQVRARTSSGDSRSYTVSLTQGAVARVTVN